MTLHISHALWTKLSSELHRRTEGRHESGAFLLGRQSDNERRAMSVIYYDDLDPAAYQTGVCVLHADAFGRLWDKCSEHDMKVIADAHVHFYGAGQSTSDRENPMIARAGHIAIILPRMARPPIRRWSVGVYEYLGDHRWQARGGCRGSTLKIGDKR